MSNFKGISFLRVVLSTRWRTLSKPERLIMISLIARSKNYQCWPSLKEIATDSGLERRAVMRAVTALKRAGHIFVWTREGMRNRYGVSVWRDPDQCIQNTPEQNDSTSEQKKHGVVNTKDTSSLYTHCLSIKNAVEQA